MIAPPKAPRLAAWLVQPILDNRKTYLEAALAAAMISCFGLLTSVFTMTVYDRVLPNNAIASLVVLSLGLGIVIVFDFVLKSLRAYFVDIAGARIDHTVGEALFHRLVAMRLELKPLMDDQELDARASTGNYYWEGAVRSSAMNTAEHSRKLLNGRGYLELTGYWRAQKL